MNGGLEVVCLVLLLLIAGLLIRKGKLRSKSNPPPPDWAMKPPAPPPPPKRNAFIERPREWPTPPPILWLAEKDEKKFVAKNGMQHGKS